MKRLAVGLVILVLYVLALLGLGQLWWPVSAEAGEGIAAIVLVACYVLLHGAILATARSAIVRRLS